MNMANLRKVVAACLLVVAVNFALEVEARHTQHVSTSHNSRVGKKLVRAPSKHSKASRRSEEGQQNETVMQHGDPEVLEQAKQILRAMSDSGKASGFRFKVSGWLSGNKQDEGLDRSLDNKATFRDNFMVDYLNQTTDLPVEKKERLMQYIRTHTKLTENKGSKKNVSTSADEFEQKDLNTVKNVTQPANVKKNATMKSIDAIENEKSDQDLKDNASNLKKNETENAPGLKYNSVFDALLEDEQKNASRGVVDGVMTQPTATSEIQEGATKTTEVDGNIADGASKKDVAKKSPSKKSNDEDQPVGKEDVSMSNELDETKAKDSKETPSKKTNDEEPPVDDADSMSMDINNGKKESKKDHAKKSNETADELTNPEKNYNWLASAKTNSSSDALSLMKENTNLTKNVTRPANSTSTEQAETTKDSSKQEKDSTWTEQAETTKDSSKQQKDSTSTEQAETTKDSSKPEKDSTSTEQAETTKDSSKPKKDAKIKISKTAVEHKKNATLANGASKTAHAPKAADVQRIDHDFPSDYESENFDRQNDSWKHLPTNDGNDDKRTISSLLR